MNPVLTMKTNNENAASTSEQPQNKVLLDAETPIEDLLGSVTTYNNVEGAESLQLRTSARVFKKMKLDSAAAALPGKKESGKKEEIKSEIKKPFPKPFWTTEDKNYFFEALNEYGKDFEAIHTYVNTKIRKKGGAPDAALKSREQIRHLYYRTWHKISKHLKFSEDVKKVVQELYGLINFGELRKKLTSISEKTCIKLNELIYRGTLAIRVKGRTIRIRTPMCKALRRLNRLEENDDDIKLPTRVLVECMPKDMYTWMKVQEMSQNPRVRILVPLQRRLNSLIYYLTQRWRNTEILEYEKLLLVNETSNSGIPNEEALFVGRIEPRNEPLLRLAPFKEVPIVLPNFNITEFFTTQSICLNAYEERLGVKQCGEALWLETYPNIKQMNKNGLNKRGTKRTRTESNSEKGSPPNTARHCAAVIDNNENCVTEGEGSNKVDEFNDEAVNTILALQQQEADVAEVVEQLRSDHKFDLNNEDSLGVVKKEHDIANIRLGWTLADCGTVTVGDLYLMFGANSKILLEYSWDDIASPVAKMEELTTNAPDALDASLPSEERTVNEEIKTTPGSPVYTVTSSLKQLVSVAKLHYRKNIIKCPCGHVCGSPTKSQSKAKLIQKQTKTPCNDNKSVLEAQSTSVMVTLQQPNITTTANMVPILIHPEIKTFSPQSLFRRPNSPNQFRAQINTVQRMMPRYCNRKGRPRSKQVVVERKLPLLANKADSGRIIQMSLVSPDGSTQPISLAPIMLPTENSHAPTATYTTVRLSSEDVLATQVAPGSEEKFQMGNMDPATIDSEEQSQNVIANDILDNATTLSRVGSPTSISNLLDIAMQNAVNEGAESSKGDGITNFVGLLSEAVDSTPPCSPTRLLKENDNQWINAEVQDFSFSSFLGHLEASPMKTSQPVNMPTLEDTRMSLTNDMDAQLQSLLTESSMDLTASFADLAAQVADCRK